MTDIEIVQKIRNMLKETNYGIRVHGHSTGCKVSLPVKKFAPHKKAKTIEYEILKGGCVNITGDDDSYWLCPEYTARAAIYIDILKKCQEYEFSPHVILYSSDDYEDANSLLEVLPAPEGVKLNTELDTLNLAQAAIQSNNIGVLVELRKEAEALNVLEGFNFLVTNFCGDVK